MLLTASLVLAAAVPQARPLPPDRPLPKGQQIEARDGDTVVIRSDARVRIVHRSEATVRAIYNSEQRWLVLLIDYADPVKGGPDGAVDSTYTFDELGGVWPLGERWEGHAVLDDYTMLNMPGGSLGIATDGAFIQLFSGSPASQNRYFADERAIALNYRGGNRANAMPDGPRQTFDEVEARAVANATRSANGGGASVSPFDGPGGSSFRTHVALSAPASMSSAQAPVRVGSRIITPTKIADVKPIMPPLAAQAGIRGTVILEITVGADGAVRDAKVLRSIPLLDQAALDAVRQWRYAPTVLNGTTVPVIFTVTVAFP
jgi:protein TonB